jgi:hypothetical protein
MKQRAQIERDAAAGNRDRNGQPAAPDWQPVTDRLPCFLWSEREREVDGQVNARIETLKLGVPEAADVTPADRINGIYDRAGTVLDPHVFRILTDQRMGRSHRELTLEVVTAAVGAGGPAA